MVPLMKFKDFIWSKNPETLDISITRDIKELPIPFHGSVMQDYGEQKRIIKGEGEFSGKRCMETYQKLAALFESGESGVLLLPNCKTCFSFLCGCYKTRYSALSVCILGRQQKFCCST